MIFGSETVKVNQNVECNCQVTSLHKILHRFSITYVWSFGTSINAYWCCINHKHSIKV